MRFWLKILGAAISAIATAAVPLIELDVWKDPGSWAVIACAVVLGVISGATLLTSAFADQREERAGKRVDLVREACAAAMVAVSTTTQLPCERLGFSVYVTPWWYRTLVPGFLRRGWIGALGRSIESPPRSIRQHWLINLLPPSPRLQLVERFRLNSALPTGIRWTYRKGTAGLCWQKRKAVGFDASDRYAPYLGYQKRQWNDVPESVRLGLEFGEFMSLQDRYAAVVVAPILAGAGAEFIGCVCLDVPWDEPSRTPDVYSKLWSDAVIAILVNAGKHVRGTL